MTKVFKRYKFSDHTSTFFKNIVTTKSEVRFTLDWYISKLLTWEWPSWEAFCEIYMSIHVFIFCFMMTIISVSIYFVHIILILNPLFDLLDVVFRVGRKSMSISVVIMRKVELLSMPCRQALFVHPAFVLKGAKTD